MNQTLGQVAVGNYPGAQFCLLLHRVANSRVFSVLELVLKPPQDV